MEVRLAIGTAVIGFEGELGVAVFPQNEAVVDFYRGANVAVLGNDKTQRSVVFVAIPHGFSMRLVELADQNWSQQALCKFSADRNNPPFLFCDGLVSSGAK